MKHIVLLVPALIISTYSAGQAGTLDPDFGNAGIVETVVSSSGSQCRAVAVQSDGRILMAGGRMVSGVEQGAITRYESDGDIDLSFALNGYLFTDLPDGIRWYTMALQPDGKIIVAGAQFSAAGHLMARFNSDGTVDNDFGINGQVVLSQPVAAMTLQPDGAILLVGTSGTAHVLSRYLADGAPDLDFGTSGTVMNDLGAEQTTGTSLAVQSDGAIFVCGAIMEAGEENVAVTRYTSAGLLDTNFGSGGSVSTECGSSTESGQGIAVQADGKVVVAVEYPSGFVTLRYLADGTADSSFGVDGQVYTLIGTSQSFTKDIIVQPDGALLVGGRGFQNSGWSFAVIRLLTDGSLDPGFGTGGIVQTSTFGVSYYPEDMELQPDGKLVMAGTRQFSGNRFCMVRYFTDLTTNVQYGIPSETALALWPNPVASSASIRVDGDFTGAAQCEVSDARGAIILRTGSLQAGGIFDLQIDTLEPGVYVLVVRNGIQVGRVRFVKE